MKKTTVLILFGGASSEHEVSCVSAASVIKNCDRGKYEILTVGITREGQWYLYSGHEAKIENGLWEKEREHLVPAVVSPDRETHGLAVFEKGGVSPIRVDCAFPVLHGKNGEDGTIQGLFTLAGIPFVGPGVGASANCMDKSVTKKLVEGSGIAQARHVTVLRHEFYQDKNKLILKIEECFQGEYPLFVKPASSGSSVAVSKTEGRGALLKALELAACHDEKIIVEEFIRGQEIEVAVLGNRRPVASVPGEIVPSNDFYDYNAKYIDNASKLFIPARLRDPDAAGRLREAAVTVFRSCGCRGMARVDFFLQNDTGVVFNEINTIPGFTGISMYPKLFEYGGMPYKELISRLISLALEDHEG